jgi:Tfp pilus assembly protein FimV
MTRLFSPTQLGLQMAAWLCATALSAATSLAAMPAADATALPVGKTYTTQAGDTIERLLKNTMPDSPLNPGLLRKALADANPSVVSGKAGQKFKSGTVLNVPEHGTLVRNTLEASMASGSEGASHGGFSASDSASRRHWVRYP